MQSSNNATDGPWNVPTQDLGPGLYMCTRELEVESLGIGIRSRPAPESRSASPLKIHRSAERVAWRIPLTTGVPSMQPAR